MNTFRLIVTTSIAVMAVTRVDAQSNQTQESSGNIQSTLSEFVGDSLEDIVGAAYEESVRQNWLSISDIRMWMHSRDDGTGFASQGDFDVSVSDLEVGDTNRERFSDTFFYTEELRESKLYAEFDSQNLVMCMRANDDGGKSAIGLDKESSIGLDLGLTEHLELESNQDATNVLMYFDAGGNVWVETGPGLWSKMNLGDMLAGAFGMWEFGIQAAIDSRVAEMIDALRRKLPYLILLDETGLFDWLTLKERNSLAYDYAKTFGAYNEDTNQWELYETLEDKLENLLRDLAMNHYAALTRFPLINFAFIFSPELVRSEAASRGVTLDEQITQSGHTKITIKSGSDEGYVFVFDQYYRLIALQDTDGSTARYAYTNVTVGRGDSDCTDPNA